MMKTKNESNNSSSTLPTENNSITPSDYSLSQSTWQGLNLVTIAAVTSGAVLAIQSPGKTILINLTKTGAFIPSHSGGIFSLIRAFYAGSLASLTSSSIRTTYITGTKKNKPGTTSEERQEPQEKGYVFKVSKAGYVMITAFGDTILTQCSESLSHYKKNIHFLPKDFKWYTLNNSYQLMMGGFTARYTAGIINFTSLCLIEDNIANHLPIADESTRHFLAGAFSGMTAAFFSYPFAVLKEHILLQSTINDKGQLATVSTFKVLTKIRKAFAQNPKEAIRESINSTAKQLPLRMALTGSIFSVIAGVGNLLGQEPLKSVIPKRFQPSFFGGSQPVQNTTEESPSSENKITS